ncbi:MAG: rRNA maturation RNase YbeY [Cellvibrionaceae bacterium]
MSVAVDLQLASDKIHLQATEQAFTNWADAAISAASGPIQQDKEVSIRIVEAEESQQLNHQYRNKNKPTNVLSFPAEFPEGVDIPFLGDLVICADIVEQEAKDQHKEPLAHWAHMVIHGTLHLLGYDHINDKEAEVMEDLETQLLKMLGYPCPYTNEGDEK